MFLYDLLRVKAAVAPVLTIDASPVGAPMYALAFNAKRPELFATAGASGVQVAVLASPVTLTVSLLPRTSS